MGGKKRIGHAAANEQYINFCQKVRDHTDFIGNFRATDDCGIGAFRIGYGATKKVQFFFHKEAGDSRNILRDSFDGSMRPMRYAKRVVDGNIRQTGKSFGKRGIVFFLFRVKTEVLEHQYFAGIQPARSHFR